MNHNNPSDVGSSPCLPSRAILDILDDGFLRVASTVLWSNFLPFTEYYFILWCDRAECCRLTLVQTPELFGDA